jgi:MFS family permease
LGKEHTLTSHTNNNAASSLFKNRAFVFLWLSSTTSFLALSTYLFAEQWYIITVLNKEGALGIVMMVTMIPRVLFMTIGGVWADRYRRSRIMLISSLVRCLLVVMMILFLQMSLLELWPLIGFALLFGVVDAFFSPANTSLLPTLVSKDVLTRSNSFIQSSNQIAMFSGPMIGGFVLTVGSFSHLFSIIATFLVLTFVFSFLIKEEENVHAISQKKVSTKEELKEGFIYVWKMPFLKNMLLILIIINFFFFGPLLNRTRMIS